MWVVRRSVLCGVSRFWVSLCFWSAFVALFWLRTLLRQGVCAARRHGHNGQASTVLAPGEITGLAQALRQPKFFVPCAACFEPVSQRVAHSQRRSSALVSCWRFRAAFCTESAVPWFARWFAYAMFCAGWIPRKWGQSKISYWIGLSPDIASS